MKKKKPEKINKKKIDLENLNFPEYRAVMDKINLKLGEPPSLPSDLPSGQWSEQSTKVLKERYLLRDGQGDIIETPDELCWRVSWNIASAEIVWGADKPVVETLARDYYKLLSSKKFLPNSPTLMNAGAGNNLQYSACFVIPVDDSLTGIFDAVKYQALIHQSGGGTGFSFSRLRPKGSIVKTSKGVASGPVSFMRIFDAATNEIKQGGKRRGANMGILRVDHPDILEFIRCKNEAGITNFNISVAITDKFMEAYKKGTSYDLIDPRNGEVVGNLSAKEVFDEIFQSAWKTGDPGLIFIDRINSGTSNPVPSLGPIESTNPCGEQPLYPFDSCNLGSIFLGYFIKNEDGVAKIDWDELKRVAKLAVRFLDNVIEMNPYPLKEIRERSLAIRRIGLGVGGWADMLVRLGIKYDSQEALELGGKIMRLVQKEAAAASEQLAVKRGAFPLWPISIYKNKKPRRNSTVTTIAPTGSISVIAGTSSAIEPLFAVAYQHIVKDKNLDRTLTYFNTDLEKLAERRNFLTDEIKAEISQKGTLSDIGAVPEDIKNTFRTAHEIDYSWHIKMQSIFQKYTENAVSKTINLRNEATVEDVKMSYLMAWETGCNGITVFRDGCKSAQVLNLGIKDTKIEKTKQPSLERPFKVSGTTYKIHTPVGNAYITINQDEQNQPLEVFVNVGKAGSDVTAMAEALGRTISTSLRFKDALTPNERAREIATQLAGIGGRRSVGFGPKKVLSLPDAVAMAFSNHFGFKINGFLSDSEPPDMGNMFIDHTTNGVSTNGISKVNNGTDKIGTKLDLALAAVPADIPANAIVAESSPGRSGDHLAAVAKSNLASISKTKLDICPSCGANALVYEEGCSKCHNCGHSEC